LFDGEGLVEESSRVDRDALACQVADGMTRDEEDAKFVLQREDLLDEVVPVDARIPILAELI